MFRVQAIKTNCYKTGSLNNLLQFCLVYHQVSYGYEKESLLRICSKPGDTMSIVFKSLKQSEKHLWNNFTLILDDGQL